MHRPLTPNEIAHLQAQACKCQNWNLIEVADGFTPDNIYGVTFSGKVRLGIFQKEILFKGGISKKAGIINATIHNCHIADNVYINHITNYIANYNIGSDCIIENIDLLETYPQATFGNGTEVAVLDETGSRKVKIFELLSASTAYLVSTFKHNTLAINAIEKLIDQFVESKKSDKGTIDNNVVIRNCTSIIDTNIGAYSEIHGVSLLKNGTVCSDKETKTLVGHNVIAKDFIISKGAKVLDASLLETCFVGESCLIGKAFSATHSLFFANCEMLHGEAVSVFAGPFTVSHHKSTLLIGGMFSFFNAGSASNMSNHMYKLGPIHYGVMLRGSKMASDSYLMWPGKIGAFSVVMGKIKKHLDTSALPYSYIIESKGEYSIMPAMNLTSVGTYRDSKKWQTRDGRKNNEKLDMICFDSLNPFIIQQLINAINTLQALKAKNPEAENYLLHGCKIRALFVKKAISLYQMMIDIYLGKCLSQNTHAKSESNTNWLDIGGLVAPEKVVNDLLEEVTQGKITSVNALNKALNNIHTNYTNYEAAWVRNFVKDKASIIQQAIEAEEKYKNLLISDAEKEFSKEVKICFGLDRNDLEKETEFITLRGEFTDNTFVKSIEEESKKKMELLKKL
ncbi:MAG: DUF4954 family protein [Paludibacteraceae bacterium]|nr:DUF4954 family protein [Paludibacteraceae bacterium]